MFSNLITRPTRKCAILFGTALAAASLGATPLQAQSFLGTSGGYQVVCTTTGGELVVRDSACDVGGTGLDFPEGFQVGNATFNDPDVGTDSTIISGGTLSINSVTTAFGGGSATFNNTVNFTGSSVTFNSNTTFENPVTFNDPTVFTATVNTANISNSGGIISANLSATSNLSVSAGATVNMGNNVVQGVAAGVANTDAVNVGQLNAATAGITTDVTALETLTATHTTQIAAIQTVNTTQATQITALQAADAALATSIDALELTLDGLDERIGKVDDRASAGTAAAVALSGAMFLPGKTFNLTGNVGTYRGAHAAALQFGALVSDNVAINAGIAHGFNKGGKTAMRAGFTIGW